MKIKNLPTNQLADGTEVRFVHIDPADSLTGRHITVAYHFDDTAKEIVFNSAECSLYDQYVKSIGRVKAKGRLAGNSTLHPNQRIPYSSVSEDGITPRYALIAEELYATYCAEDAPGEED